MLMFPCYRACSSASSLPTRPILLLNYATRISFPSSEPFRYRLPCVRIRNLPDRICFPPPRVLYRSTQRVELPSVIPPGFFKTLCTPQLSPRCLSATSPDFPPFPPCPLH